MTLYEIAINIITQENSIIEDWLKFKIENPKEENKTVCYVEAPKDINKLQILDAWLEQIEKSKKDIRNFYKKVVTKDVLESLMSVLNALIDMSKQAIGILIAQHYSKEGDDDTCKS